MFFDKSRYIRKPKNNQTQQGKTSVGTPREETGKEQMIPSVAKADPAALTQTALPLEIGKGSQQYMTMAELTWQRLNVAQRELASPAEPAQSRPTDYTPSETIPIIRKRPELPPELKGKIINDLYRIDSMLTGGGMGQVLLAYHLKREMPVVIKLMLKQVSSNDAMSQRFIKECMLTARIRHPNVVKVFDYGILLDTLKPYLVMELVEGESLRERIRTRGRFAIGDLAKIMMCVCDGLQEVHGKEIIHRDLKPENIMVRGGGWGTDNVKILDFGIAQLQDEAMLNADSRVIGSLGYMSPERLLNQPIDHRTDIYSLGVIFYEALTGAAPFKGTSAIETMAMHVKAAHTPPSKLVQCDHPELVDRIVQYSLAKHADNRYQTADQMKQDLAQLLG